MADNASHFRNALGGFHKGDVIAYIEKTATQHRFELLEREQTIAALREENHTLQQQLNLLMMATPVAPVAPAAAEPVAAPEPAPIENADLMSLELQAYRRAEAVERNASNRARKLYQQLESVCEDTLDEFQLTDSAVKNTIELMLQQANSLEQAYQTLSAALQASREKLAAMNDFLSDSE